MYMEFLLKRVKQNKFDEYSTTKLCTASLLENMKTSYALFQEMHFLMIWKSRVISRIMLKFKMTDQLTSLCQAKNAKNLWRRLQIIYVILYIFLNNLILIFFKIRIVLIYEDFILYLLR